MVLIFFHTPIKWAFAQRLALNFFSRSHFEIVLFSLGNNQDLTFLVNCFLSGDNLHEMSNAVLWEK